jgi:AmmeMemoRadiSam system protein B
MRKPIVSGMFYSSDKEQLKADIKKCYSSKFGPSKTEEKVKVFAAVCPHAGYVYSGACAAHCYSQISNQKYDTFIILGTNHTGIGGSCVSLDDFETPLGVAKNDTELTKKIIERCRLKESKEAHAKEHSIEVQLPFLQDMYKDVKITPIIVDFGSDYKKIARGIAETVKTCGKTVCVIASSDFTHHGISYGFIPFKSDVKENLEGFDFKAILKILALDSDGFLGYIEDTGATICGAYAIATLIEICKILGKKDTKLLKYYTSGDVSNDFSSAVGYAGIIIKE